MKKILVTLFLLSSIVVIAFLVIQPIEQKKHSEQEMANISKALTEKFSESQKDQAQQPVRPATKQTAKPVAKQVTEKDDQAANQNPATIIAVIYKQPEATWFIKAKDSKQKIDTISASFKNYFIDQLKFDGNHQPIFTHIPDTMKTTNKSSMRVATYMIGDVEISVSKLAGQQDVFANVKRWMGQVGLDDNSAIQLDFSNDKKTIIVRMPR